MNFILLPFHATGPVKQIDGKVTRSGSCLNFEFRLSDVSSIVLAEPVSAPERRTGLWESTCFESFIGLSGQELYIECNFSSSGHWQVFEFEHYRSTPTSSNSVKLTGTYLSESPDHKVVQCTVDINHPRFVTQEWHISPTAILADLEGGRHYYATAHPEKKPDFHLATQRTLIL